jgi:hypothetical protein
MSWIRAATVATIDASMLPEVRLRLPDGLEVTAGPGAVIGRTHTADVRIDDGRVSEVHAYVSLRGAQLVLMALRGRVRCGERDVPRLELAAGQQIELAPGLVLDVVDVRLPDVVLALEAPGMTRQVLLGVTSIVARPAPHLVAGTTSDAAALVWSDGVAWRIRIGTQRPRALRAGDEPVIEDVRFRAVAQEVGRVGVGETSPATPGQRLRIVSLFDSVQLWRDGATSPCLLRGGPARLVAELLALGGPVRWETLARSLWTDDADASTLRHRLDITVAKARRLLADAGLRRDLITAHRNGWLELVIYPGDVADDRA